jgi:hypothetical protein
MALTEMLAIQIAAAAILFPDLLKGRLRLFLAIGSAIPMLALAGLLSASSETQILAAGAYGVGWLLTLYAWQRLLTSTYRQGLGIAIAGLWAIGGPVLAYLRADFWSQPGSANGLGFSLATGPIMAAIDLLKNQTIGAPEAFLLILFLTGVIASAIFRSRRV